MQYIILGLHEGKQQNLFALPQQPPILRRSCQMEIGPENSSTRKKQFFKNKIYEGLETQEEYKAEISFGPWIYEKKAIKPIGKNVKIGDQGTGRRSVSDLSPQSPKISNHVPRNRSDLSYPNKKDNITTVNGQVLSITLDTKPRPSLGKKKKLKKQLPVIPQRLTLKSLNKGKVSSHELKTSLRKSQTHKKLLPKLKRSPKHHKLSKATHMKHNSKVSLIPCKKGVPNEVIYNYCMNPDPQKKLALKLPSSMQITSYLKYKKHKEEHARRPSKNNIDLLQELCDYRFGKLS